jgi:hypothetical protein
MKTIKRVLLSVILLQAVCQPVHASICLDSEAATPSNVKYIPSQAEYSEQTKVIGGIAITLLMIHLAFVMYDWHKNNQEQPEKKSMQEKANFAQFADDYTSVK